MEDGKKRGDIAGGMLVCEKSLKVGEVDGIKESVQHGSAVFLNQFLPLPHVKY